MDSKDDAEPVVADPRLAAIPDSHGHAKGEHKPFLEERPIPYTARMLFLWFFHACRRGSPRFMMVADHMNYLTFEDPAAVNLVRRALKLAQAGDLFGAAETAGVEVGHAKVVSDGLRRGMRYSIGAEVDNDPRSRPDAQNIVDAMKPDGMVRSVHFLPITHPTHGENWMWAFDNPEFKDLYELVGTETVWEIYMATLLDAIEKLPGNIVGHFYVPAVFGHWPDDAVLEGYEDKLVDACAERGMAIELNSRYIYKHYLGDEAQLEKFRAVHVRLMRKAKDKGVEIAVGSDAHSPKDQGRAFEAVLALLDEVEINEIAFPIGGRLARVALRATEEFMKQFAPPEPEPLPPAPEPPPAPVAVAAPVKAKKPRPSRSKAALAAAAEAAGIAQAAAAAEAGVPADDVVAPEMDAPETHVSKPEIPEVEASDIAMPWAESAEVDSPLEAGVPGDEPAIAAEAPAVSALEEPEALEDEAAPVTHAEPKHAAEAESAQEATREPEPVVAAEGAAPPKRKAPAKPKAVAAEAAPSHAHGDDAKPKGTLESIADAVKSVISSAVEAIVPHDRRHDHAADDGPADHAPADHAPAEHAPAEHAPAKSVKGTSAKPVAKNAAVKAPAPAASSKPPAKKTAAAAKAPAPSKPPAKPAAKKSPPPKKAAAAKKPAAKKKAVPVKTAAKKSAPKAAAKKSTAKKAPVKKAAAAKKPAAKKAAPAKKSAAKKTAKRPAAKKSPAKKPARRR